MQLLRYAFHVVHGIGHSHRVLTRGHERMIICGQRWPFGKVVINYQAHQHAAWRRLELDEFSKVLSNAEWTQHG